MGKLDSDWGGFGPFAGIPGCSVYPCLGSGAGVVTERTDSVGWNQPQQALLLQLIPSWSAGLKRAAVAVVVKRVAGGPFWSE